MGTAGVLSGALRPGTTTEQWGGSDGGPRSATPQPPFMHMNGVRLTRTVPVGAPTVKWPLHTRHAAVAQAWSVRGGGSHLVREQCDGPPRPPGGAGDLQRQEAEPRPPG